MTPDQKPSRAAKPRSPRVLTLYRKLLEAAREMQPQPKTGVNPEEGYAYVEAGPIIAAARKALLERGVLIIPRINSARTEIPPETSKRYSRSTYLELEYTVLDTETGEYFTIPWASQGVDSTDKGTSKALTAGLKYVLIGLLLIPIGEDPEADASVDRDAKREGAAKRGALVKTDEEIREHLAKPAETIMAPRPEFDPLQNAKDLFALRCKRLGMRGRGSGTTRLKLASEILERKVRKVAELTLEDYRALNEELFRRSMTTLMTAGSLPNTTIEPGAPFTAVLTSEGFEIVEDGVQTRERGRSSAGQSSESGIGLAAGAPSSEVAGSSPVAPHPVMVNDGTGHEQGTNGAPEEKETHGEVVAETE